MKKYDVYGIGNALVDMEFEVSDLFLDKMNVKKGLMTLVCESRQRELLEALNGSHKKRCCGGSAANTIIGVQQFGGSAFYSCKVAADETGDFYYTDLLENGVGTNMSMDRPEGNTGKCLVMVTPDAERTMNTFLGISETLSTTAIDEEAIKNSEFVYIEGYLVTSPTGKEAAVKTAKIARENGIKIAFTFSDPFLVECFKDGLNDIIEDGVDLLFCNEHEAMAYTGTDNIIAAADEIKKFAKSFAITMGPKGALVYDGDREISIVTNKVEPLDTNGAGDLFAGAFLYAITNGHSYIGAGRLACYAASRLVTKFGARLSSKEASDIKESIFD